MPKTAKKKRIPVYNFTYLHSKEEKKYFADTFSNYCQVDYSAQEHIDLNEFNNMINHGFRSACEEIIPLKEVRALRPWISSTTLNLIEKRNIARAENNFDHERILNREIKQ